MLSAASIPTPLVTTREAVPTVRSAPPRRFPVVIISARLAWWCLTVLWLRLIHHDGAAAYGRRFRELLESLGGLWIKLGQLLSLRVDLFPLDFCRELSNLQIKVIGFPVEEAIEVLEADLGKPLASVFRDFDPAPFAAASMGQVHLAHLRTSGVRVAVKVQRPNLPEVFRQQLRIIEAIVWILQQVGFRPNLRWDELIWELTEIMKEEMDCRYEASATRRMRRTLRGHGIYAPKIFFATRRVLVTEFVDGVLMADYIQVLGREPERVASWLAENRVDPTLVGRHLILSLLRQILEDNLFHGDLHPGNIMLLRDNGIALIDFGAVSFTEREYLQRFHLTVQALAVGRFDQASDLTLLLCGPLPRVDLDAIKEAFASSMHAWAVRTGVAGVPYHERSVAVIYNEVIRILYEHNCTMEWALLRIRRAQETLDASLLYLVPDVDYRKIATRYFRTADRRRSTATIEDAARPKAGPALVTALDAIEQAREFALFRMEAIRRSVRRFEAATNHIGDLCASGVSRLAIASCVGTALVVTVFLVQQYPASMGTLLGEGILGVLDTAPRLDNRAWSIVLFGSAGACVAMMRLRWRLLHADVTDEQVALP